MRVRSGTARGYARLTGRLLKGPKGTWGRGITEMEEIVIGRGTDAAKGNDNQRGAELVPAQGYVGHLPPNVSCITDSLTRVARL